MDHNTSLTPQITLGEEPIGDLSGSPIIYKNLLATMTNTVECCRQALKNAQRYRPVTSEDIEPLAHALDNLDRFVDSQEVAEERVSLYREALRTTADHSDQDSLRLSLSLGLARALSDLYDHRKMSSDIEESILISRQLLSTITDTHMHFSGAVHDLARALQLRYINLLNLEDLDEAVSLLETVTGSHLHGHPQRHRYLRSLGVVYALRHKRRGDFGIIQSAVHLLRGALALTPWGHPERPRVLISLGSALYLMSRSSSDKVLCQDSFSAYVSAFEIRHSVGLSAGATSIAASMVKILMHDLTGNETDLYDALSLGKRGLADDPGDQRLSGLQILSSVSFKLFRLKGDASHVDSAISIFHETLELCEEKEFSTQLETTLLNTGAAYGTRFEAFGLRDDLDQSIMLYRRVLSSPNITHEVKAVGQGNLSLSLTCRFDIAGDIADINEALVLAKSSTSDLQVGDVRRTLSLSNLGDVLTRRYLAFQKRDDLDAAIEALFECHSHMSAMITHRGERTISLAKALLLRYKDFTQSDEDLDRVIALGEHALLDLQEGHPRRHHALNILSEAFIYRFTKHNVGDDYDQAMLVQRDALSLLPQGHTDRAQALLKLSRLLLINEGPGYNIVDAMSLCIEAISDSSGVAHVILSTILDILPLIEAVARENSFSIHNRQQLLILYNHVIDLLPRTAYFGLDLHTRLRILSKTEHIALSAAAHALQLGQIETTVELLDHGRGVFWSQSLRLRSQFSDLPPELADKLASSAQRLDNGSRKTFAPRNSSGKVALEEEATYMHRLSAEFEDLLEQVRQIPGRERFLRNDEFSMLAEAATQGPIIILVSGLNACSAIILRRSTSPQHITLPDISGRVLEEYSIVLKDTNFQRKADSMDFDEHNLSHQSKNVPDSTSTTRLGFVRQSAPRTSDSFYLMLEDLWIKVMKPVATALGLKCESGHHRPRVWICPTGSFNLLPIHAAGTYNRRKQECCSDYFVVSYTPTLKALINARQAFKSPCSDKVKALVAAVPVPIKGRRLPAVVEEVKAVRAVIPSASVLNLPPQADCMFNEEAGPTAQMILDAAPEAAIIHLASHGTQNHENALNSGFIMQDTLLTVSMLMELNLPNAFFAFLSACETAKGDSAQPDQVIHLAATMLYVGYRSIVGTMWTMYDKDGPAVATEVYTNLFCGDAKTLDHNAIPYALDSAVQKLRRRGLHPSRWAPYIHLGV